MAAHTWWSDGVHAHPNSGPVTAAADHNSMRRPEFIPEETSAMRKTACAENSATMAATVLGAAPAVNATRHHTACCLEMSNVKAAGHKKVAQQRCSERVLLQSVQHRTVQPTLAIAQKCATSASYSQPLHPSASERDHPVKYHRERGHRGGVVKPNGTRSTLGEVS